MIYVTHFHAEAFKEMFWVYCASCIISYEFVDITSTRRAIFGFSFYLLLLLCSILPKSLIHRERFLLKTDNLSGERLFPLSEIDFVLTQFKVVSSCYQGHNWDIDIWGLTLGDR